MHQLTKVIAIVTTAIYIENDVARPIIVLLFVDFMDCAFYFKTSSMPWINPTLRRKQSQWQNVISMQV